MSTVTLESSTEIEWCVHHIDSQNDSLRHQIAQYKLWTTIYVVIGFCSASASFLIDHAASQYFMQGGGALLSLVVAGYPFSKVFEQKRKIDKNDFLRESLNHPKIPKDRKKTIIEMIYDSSKKGLES